jgi:hypothetical protein
VIGHSCTDQCFLTFKKSFISIMAILNGIISKMKGSAGDLVFRQVGDRTIVCEKPASISNPRTDAQMKQRTKWGNIIAMYKGIKPLINYGFENKPANNSDYNMFVKLNTQQTPVYLTKQQIAGGGCVATDYKITQGSLPSIVISGTGNSSATDIYLGSLSIGAATTVGEFSQAVVQNNADYKYGDQISYFEIAQKTNAETGIPYCQFSAHKVILDANDTSVLWDVAGRTGFYGQDSMLGHYGASFVGAFGWVHSRKSGGKTLVSSQTLVAVNATILAEHQGELAYNLAKSSYGSGVEAFLTPDADSTGTGNAPSGGGNGGGGNDSL